MLQNKSEADAAKLSNLKTKFEIEKTRADKLQEQMKHLNVRMLYLFLGFVWNSDLLALAYLDQLEVDPEMAKSELQEVSSS